MGVMTPQKAKSILVAATEGGYLQDAIPESENVRIELAEYYVTEARKFLAEEPAKARRDRAIKQIINIAESETTARIETLEDHGLEHNLPIPREITREPTDMPIDLTTLPDRELRKLHGEFNAYLNRARWLLTVTSGEVAGLTNLRDAKFRAFYLKHSAELNEKGEKTTQNGLETLAKSEAEYITLDTKLTKVQEKLMKYKTLVEIYNSNVERLSREWTMRQNEWERAR